MKRTPFPPRTGHELEGWALMWARLAAVPGATVDLDQAWETEITRLRERLGGINLSELPEVAAIRRLFREAGTDPTRYRPSSEALARRVLKGSLPPPIHPLVDFNNLLSVRLLLPCCVIEPGAVVPPFVLRRGCPGETMDSMRGPFSLEGKPVLEDRRGPFGTPVTDNERVRVTPATEEAWLVVYAPAGAAEGAGAVLGSMAREFPAVELLEGPAGD